jgi:hypothetical protein
VGGGEGAVAAHDGKGRRWLRVVGRCGGGCAWWGGAAVAARGGEADRSCETAGETMAEGFLFD